MLKNITFVDSDARTGDTGDAPRARDASVDMAKKRLDLFITSFSSLRIILARNGTSN
jgi:hypothetical protein